MIFITSPLSLPSLSLLHLLSLSSSLLFCSPLRGLPLSLLWSFLVCLVLFSSFFSLFCAVTAAAALLLLLLPSLLVLLLCCSWLLVVAIAARAAAVGAAGGSCVFLSGCFSFRVGSPDLTPLDFHLWQEWETALGDRQFTSQLELRATIVRTVSALDPEAAEKARTTGFIHRCLACVRARGGLFEHRL